MKQRFFTNTIVSNFIKALVYNTPIPHIKTINDNSYLIKDNTYLYKNNIIKCTDTGINKLPEIDAGKTGYYKNGQIKISDEDITDSGYVPITKSKSKVVDNFSFGQYYPKYTELFCSEHAYYDSETHEKLGELLRCYRDIYDINLMPYYNCVSGRYISDISISETYDYFVEKNSTETYSDYTLDDSKFINTVKSQKDKKTFQFEYSDDLNSWTIDIPEITVDNVNIDQNNNYYSMWRFNNILVRFPQIMDLTNTVWVIKDVPNLNSSSWNSYYINFISGQQHSPCTLFALSNIGITYQIAGNLNTVYDKSSSTWSNNAYKTITILGGSDVTNLRLIDWLYTNATLVSNPFTYSGTFYYKNNDSLIENDSLMIYNSELSYSNNVVYSSGWTHEYYKDISIKKLYENYSNPEADKDLLTWLKDNATFLGAKKIVDLDNYGITLGETLAVNGDTIKINYSFTTNSELRKVTNSDYKIFRIPIKFNTTYTLALDCNYKVSIAPVLLSKNHIINEIEGISLTDELIKDNIFTYNSLSFTQPITLGINTLNKDIADILQKYEKYLYLLIQVPKENNSSIVLLEGDYTGVETIHVYNSEKLDDLSDLELSELMTTGLSLLQINDNVTYPFADRLIEYLLLGVICSTDEITENVGRIQESFPTTNFVPDVWDNKLRNAVYLNFQRIGLATRIDLNGFVDSSTEALIKKLS